MIKWQVFTSYLFFSQSKYPIRKTISVNPCFLRQRKLFRCQNNSKNKLKNNKISLIGRLPLFCHFTAAIKDMKLKGLWALLWKSPSYNNSSLCLKATCTSRTQSLETSRHSAPIQSCQQMCCLLRPNIISRLNLFISRFRAIFPCQHCTLIQAFSHPDMCFLLHLHRHSSFNILPEHSFLGQSVKFYNSSEHCTCSSFTSPDLADLYYTHSPAEEVLSVQQPY